MQYIKLNNGIMMPQVGYGVYQVPPPMCVRNMWPKPSVWFTG